jgi:16S rRNA G966 N2-methylase RsmD
MYKGGKNNSGVYQSIINLLPYHDIYYELFAGSGAIYFYKLPATISFLMDKMSLDMLPLKKRIRPGDQFIQANAIDFIHSAVGTINLLVTGGFKVLIYLDPPYPLSTRSYQGYVYKYELSNADHIKLLTDILSLNCMVAISSYRNDLYDKMLSNWRQVSFFSHTRSGKREEILYMNYPVPSRLHDYRYYGSNSKERERFKLISNHMVSKFNRLPAALRQHILNQIQK